MDGGRVQAALQKTASDVAPPRPLRKFLIYAVCAGIGYWVLNFAGCIEHKRVVEVTLSGIWQDGELKTCMQLTSADADLKLNCTSSDGAAHVFEIAFWGPLSQPDSYKQWKCKKTGAEISCKEG